MYIGPTLSVAKGGTLDGSVTTTFGAGGYIASYVPVCGGLPDGLGSSLACTVHLREAELSPWGCGAVAEFFAWKLQVVLFQ